MNKHERPLRPQSQQLLEQQHEDGTTRWISVNPAYDFTTWKQGNYGIHGMEWVFGIRRGDTAVTWTLMASWFLKETRTRLEQQHGLHSNGYDDGLGNVDYHSPVALWEGQETAHVRCKYTGGNCFADGSATASGDFFEKLVSEGEVWPQMLKWLEDTEKKVASMRDAERNYT